MELTPWSNPGRAWVPGREARGREISGSDVLLRRATVSGLAPAATKFTPELVEFSNLVLLRYKHLKIFEVMCLSGREKVYRSNFIGV